MAQDQLDKLYAKEPSARGIIEKAEGYAVFSNLSSNVLIFLASGNGYGMVVDNETGKETFMRMTALGGGFGIGITDYYAIIAFHDRAAMEEFSRGSFEFSGEADATAKGGGVGGSAAGDTGTGKRTTVWEITNQGLQLGVSIKGATFKVDPNLTVGDDIEGN
jgi:lipid-binding SYLF domain-containing protein